MFNSAVTFGEKGSLENWHEKTGRNSVLGTYRVTIGRSLLTWGGVLF